jgi:hypothetical protein
VSGVVNIPRSISLEWSPALWLATIFVHALVATSVLPAEVPTWARVLVWAGCTISLGANVRHAISLRSAVLCPAEEGATLRLGAVELQGRVLRDSLSAGGLIVLHWLPEGGGRVRYFCLLKPGIAAEEWRQLKIWLRWRVQSSA